MRQTILIDRLIKSVSTSVHQPKASDESEKKFLAGTPIDPSPRIRLEAGSTELTMRAMDMICPIAWGSAAYCGTPGSGKTPF